MQSGRNWGGARNFGVEKAKKKKYPLTIWQDKRVSGTAAEKRGIGVEGG